LQICIGRTGSGQKILEIVVRPAVAAVCSGAQRRAASGISP
jgi:hypothetical protein